MGARSSNAYPTLQASLLICLLFLACGMGTYSSPPADQPMTLAGLMEFLGLPAPCNAPVDWEGRLVAVEGYVDPVNVFDKRRYPGLPYEKFSLKDRQGRVLEVWPQAQDNQLVFDKLAGHSGNKVIVRGRLAPTRAPVMGSCNLGVKVLLDGPDQLELQIP